MLTQLVKISSNAKIGKIPAIILTFIITLVGWVIFASKDLAQIKSYLFALIGAGDSSAVIIINIQSWVILLFAVFFSFCTLIPKIKIKLNFYEALENLSQKQAIYLSSITFILMTISLCYVAASGFNPFIYFRF